MLNQSTLKHPPEQKRAIKNATRAKRKLGSFLQSPSFLASARMVRTITTYEKLKTAKTEKTTETARQNIKKLVIKSPYKKINPNTNSQKN